MSSAAEPAQLFMVPNAGKCTTARKFPATGSLRVVVVDVNSGRMTVPTAALEAMR